MAVVDLKAIWKEMTQGYILVPHINRYQDAGEFPETWNVEIRNYKESDPYFHPSGDTFTSPEQLAKEKLGKATKMPVRHPLRRIFDCGHFWHGYYQGILVEMGVVEPDNVERSFTVNRRNFVGKGTVDLYDVQIPGSKGKWIVDLKTVSDTEYDTGIREETMKKWTAQLSLYGEWTGCRNLMILAIRKGGTKNPTGGAQHDLKEFIIKYDEELVEEIYDRWEKAQNLILEDPDGLDLD